MKTQPNKADVNAVAGGSLGSKSAEELTKMSAGTDSLLEAGRDMEQQSDLKFGSKESSTESNKYPASTDVAYFARGTISAKPADGKFLFTDVNNEPSRPAMVVDKASSSLYSSGSNTTLGTLNVNTVDGYELNQIGATYPSTNYSPTKAWNKQLLPTLPVRGLTSIAVLALVQQTLNKLLKGLNSNTTAETITRKEDMITLIVDNQAIEDELFTEYFN